MRFNLLTEGYMWSYSDGLKGAMQKFKSYLCETQICSLAHWYRTGSAERMGEEVWGFFTPCLEIQMRTCKSCEIAILHLITWFWCTSSSVLFWEWFMLRQLSTPAPPQCIPVLEGLGLSLWLWNKRTAGTLRFTMDAPQQGSASGFPIFFHNAVPLEYSCEYTLCLRGWFTIVQRRTIRSGAVLVVCL